MIIRKLGKDMMLALKQMADPKSEPNWWQDLLNSWAPAGSMPTKGRYLRLAIRKDYLNFYHCGQSIAKVALGRGRKPYARVHEKFINPLSAGQNYARLSGANTMQLKSELTSSLYEGVKSLRTWSASSETYANPEKIGIEKIIQRYPDIIDIELGVPAWDEQANDTGRAEGSRKFAPRMDLVALEEVSGGSIRVAFWEAKTVRDDRLRIPSGSPEVLKQLRTYERYLSREAYGGAALEACRDTCRIICDIHQMASDLAGDNGMPPIGTLIQKVCQGHEIAAIDSAPRLMIFKARSSSGVETEPKGWPEHLNLLRSLVPVSYAASPEEVSLDYEGLSIPKPSSNNQGTRYNQ